mmetsp:Transcript_23081/g.71965  ORF Transcript_23081/g.71965 Transcript_23081/m.71965 type:complete len:263 (+) Transcript_23081:425-1213(+)
MLLVGKIVRRAQRQRERDGAAEPAHPEQVLVVARDRRRPHASAGRVDQVRVGVDVGEARHEACDDRDDGEHNVPPALASEEGVRAHVDENECLRQVREDFEKALGGRLRLIGEVLNGVVGHDDAAEEDRHDAAQLQPLSEHVGHVWEHEQQADLHHRPVPATPVVFLEVAPLEHQRAQASHQRAHSQRASEDHHERPHRPEARGKSDRLGAEDEEGVVKHDRDGVVEHALPKDQCVEVLIRAELLKHRQHRDGVCGRDKTPE